MSEPILIARGKKDAFILPPHSQIGPIDNAMRDMIIRRSPIYGHYEKTVDRESAYEMLKRRAEEAALETSRQAASTTTGGSRGGRQPDTLMEVMAKSAARAIGSRVGREIIRGVFGTIFGGKR